MVDADTKAIEFMKSFIDNRRWKQATSKQYEKVPHAYTIREWYPNDQDDFEKVVNIIREYGYPEKFYSKTFIYLRIDDYKYWTMGNPVNETTVINRASYDKTYN